MLYFKSEDDRFKTLSFITCFSRPCHETLFRKDSKMLTDVYCHLFKGIVDIVFVVLTAPFSFSLPWTHSHLSSLIMALIILFFCLYYNYWCSIQDYLIPHFIHQTSHFTFFQTVSNALLGKKERKKWALRLKIIYLHHSSEQVHLWAH